MLKLADLDFEIESAILEAFVDVDDMVIRWGVEVQAKPGSGELSRWAPKAVSEQFFASGPGEMNHWMDLAGTRVAWADPSDSEGEYRGTLYVFEHAPVYSSQLTIGKGKADGLSLSWEGKSDVNWTPEYGAGLDFSIETDLRFIGIWFGRQPEKECAPLLSQFLDPGLFEFVKTEHGVSLFRPSSPSRRA